MPKGIYLRTEEQKQKLINLNKSLGHGFQKGHKINTDRHPSEEHKLKLSEALKGEKGYWFGKQLSEETKLKLSVSHKGQYISDEVKQKISEAKKGIKKSLETRQRMSLAQLGEKHPLYGKHLPEDLKIKISLALSGEKNPNWKGGITSENHRVRSSYKYIDWRIAVYQRDNYTCQLCGDSKGHNLNAHHIKSFAEYIELRFDVNNGITYCEDCHEANGFHKKVLIA